MDVNYSGSVRSLDRQNSKLPVIYEDVNRKSIKLDEIRGDFPLNAEDEYFVEIVKKDIEHFLNPVRVNSYRRLLIHRCCAVGLRTAGGVRPETFSIGQGNDRRTVVCFPEQFVSNCHFGAGACGVTSVLPVREEVSLAAPGGHHVNVKRRMGVEQESGPHPSNHDGQANAKASSKHAAQVGIYRPPAARRGEVPPINSKYSPPSSRLDASTAVVAPVDVPVAVSVQRLEDTKPTNTTPSRQRERRPDRAVYVPRGRRSAPASERERNTDTVCPTPTPSSPYETHQVRVCPKSKPHQIPSLETARTTLAESNSHIVTKNEAANGTGDVHQNGIISVNQNNISNCSTRSVNSKPNLCSEKTSFPFCDIRNDISRRSLITELYLNNKYCDSNIETIATVPDNFSENIINTRMMSQPRSNVRILDDYDAKAEDGEVLEFQRASEEINRSNRRIIKQRFVSDVLVISEPEPGVRRTSLEIAEESREETPLKKQLVRSSSSSEEKWTAQPLVSVNPDEDDWDSMFDDNGDCLDPKLLEELTANVGQVTIEKPKSDYRAFQNKAQILLTDDEFPHVLEIYDFPPDFKTQDLLSVFSPYKGTGFEIKWVDDTHALGVFSSSRIAAEVLELDLPLVKTRPLREATHSSRNKARRSAEFLQPYRARPETCAALARRLVTGALGVRLKTAAAEREKERQVLKEAKERKLLAARQRDDAWECETYTSPNGH